MHDTQCYGWKLFVHTCYKKETPSQRHTYVPKVCIVLIIQNVLARSMVLAIFYVAILMYIMTSTSMERLL